MTKPSITPLKIGLEALETAEQKRNRWERTFNEMFQTNTLYSTYMNDLEEGLIQLLKEIYHDTDVIERWVYEFYFGKSAYFKNFLQKNKSFPFTSIEDMYRYFIQCIPDDDE